jgi:hypothetical protein
MRASLRFSSAAPVRVRPTLRVVRWNNRVLNACSSLAMVLLTLDFGTPSARAAAAPAAGQLPPPRGGANSSTLDAVNRRRSASS